MVLWGFVFKPRLLPGSGAVNALLGLLTDLEDPLALGTSVSVGRRKAVGRLSSLPARWLGPSIWGREEGRRRGPCAAKSLGGETPRDPHLGAWQVRQFLRGSGVTLVGFESRASNKL